MKLRDVDVIVVGNPPPGFGGRYFIFVKVTTACGIVGWGECYAATVGPEAMRAVIADVFARHMEGENPENIELMFRRCYSAGFTQRPDPTVMGAFSGLEIACWDILGKAWDRPVHALWGGRMWDRLRSYSYLYPGPNEQAADFYNNPEASAAEAARMVECGFTAIKFDPAGAYTIRGGHQPTMPDIERSAAFCREIRAAVGDRADLLFGTHGQFTPSGAVRLAQAIEPYHPLWFEEPVPPDAPLDFATVADSTRIPIATGERLSTKADFAVLLRSGGVGMVQPNVGRVGGLLEARKVAILAEAFSVQLAPHIYCGPVAWAASVQLGLSVPNFLVLETIGTCDGFYGALIGNTIQWEDGYVVPPTGPGLGIEVDEDLARVNPWQGDRLHLEMSEEPPDPRGESRFAGG